MSELDWTVVIAMMSAVLFLAGVGLLVYYAIKRDPVEKDPAWYEGQPNECHVEMWHRAAVESQRRSNRRRPN